MIADFSGVAARTNHRRCVVRARAACCTRLPHAPANRPATRLARGFVVGTARYNRRVSSTRVLAALRTGTLVALITLGLFLVLEGGVNVAYSLYVLFVRDDNFMAEEQKHAEYDAQLGWVNRPNLDLPDLYGRGVGFRTNGQRFRADHDYPPEPPAGISRIVCSGDSFTMGHSVGDRDAWCALLATLTPGVETVNMGMAAYGIDQAFLWYQRDGAVLRHDLQVFAFITSDFERMAYDNFGGYPKPYLRVVDGGLQVTNVPVPRVFDAVPRLARQRDALLSLGLVRHGGTLMQALGVRPSAPDRVLNDDDVRAVSVRIFDRLVELNRAKGSRLVLVHLPRTGDKHSTDSDPWREFVRAEAQRLGVTFVDLVEAFRTLALDDGEQMFVVPYQPSHYNTRGNAWVARQLRDRLLAQ